MHKNREINIGTIIMGRSLRSWVRVIAVLLLAGISGCTFSRAATLAETDPEPLPVYQEGTTYVYTDGRWETVYKVGPEGVTWHNHLGHLSTGSADFTYRHATWKTQTRSGGRSFRARSDWLGRLAATSVWPLATGKKAHFIESGRWQDDKGKMHTYLSRWRLEVSGRTRVRVKAGEFDTWKIVARRFSSGGAFKESRLREIRTWYYAPAVGHYVKMESNFLGRRPKTSLELVAVTPPVNGMTAEARRSVQAAFQQALEEKRSGVTQSWQLAEYDLAGSVTPVATFRLGSGTYCRQYIQQLNRAREEKVFYGLACRTPKGEWEIPRR